MDVVCVAAAGNMVPGAAMPSGEPPPPRPTAGPLDDPMAGKAAPAAATAAAMATAGDVPAGAAKVYERPGG